MPRSNFSGHSSPGPGTRFDPFLILEEAHAQHYQSANIIELPDSDRIFCPTCLELRSADDINAMDPDTYRKYVTSLFEILERFSETSSIRKIIFSILEVFLPRRSFVVRDDHQFHKILRILYKLMKSELYNQNEFLPLARILSGLSADSLQSVPLRSVWEAWAYMLDYGEKRSFTSLISQDSEQVPENLTKYYIGQALIVKSYLAVINRLSETQISEIFFNPTTEFVIDKYYAESQMRCLRFFKDLLVPNCECYLARQTAQSTLELMAISEMFSALKECFINADRRRHEQFIKWLQEKDIVAIIHRIFARNPSSDYRHSIKNFLKLYIQYHVEKEYGRLDELRNFLQMAEIETVANKVEVLAGQEEHIVVYVSYLLLNWVAIKLGSQYYVASRVRRLISKNSPEFSAVRRRIKRSRLFMRIYAFVAATCLHGQPNNDEVTRFLEEDWREIFLARSLALFRYTYCFEICVFEWAYRNEHFMRCVTVIAISYVIDRGLDQNQILRLLPMMLEYPDLRAVFCRYLKRNAYNLFQKLSSLGNNVITRRIMDDFSCWLPALLQETILRYVNVLNQTVNDPDELICGRLIDFLKCINFLMSEAQKMKFNPIFEEQFVIDFTNLVEMTYQSLDPVTDTLAASHQLKIQLLIEANYLMAFMMKFNFPCVLKLVQYIDFTLIGYMYHILDGYKDEDCLGESIAHLLIAYSNLDYPLNHRIERSLYPVFSNVFEWMMSRNEDLHLLSLIIVDRLYSDTNSNPNEASQASNHNLSNRAKACIVTGFMHMLCADITMVENQPTKTQVLRILEHEDFRYHPLYNLLVRLAPTLQENLQDESSTSASSPDLSFASADTGQFEEEQISVSRILEQLNDDEGYRSASATTLPGNIYLNRVVDEQTQDEDAGTLHWERRVYEETQTINTASQHGRT